MLDHVLLVMFSVYCFLCDLWNSLTCEPKTASAAIGLAFFWFFAGLVPMVIGGMFGLIGMAIGGVVGVYVVYLATQPKQTSWGPYNWHPGRDKK